MRAIHGLLLAFLLAAVFGGVNARADDAAKSNSAQGQATETWRYKWHNGQWWYWLPTEKWVYWVDDHWTPYDPQTFAQQNATRSRQSYSYPSASSASPQQYQGNWGPVRYNQYGQPQYPYSQRTSGLRQLGPVPAPGGVRSLPGWGGER